MSELLGEGFYDGEPPEDTFDDAEDAPGVDGELGDAEFGDGAGEVDLEDDEDHARDRHQDTAAAAAAATNRSGYSGPRGTPGTGDDEDDEPPEPMFTALDEWVNKWLLPVYRRNVDSPSLTFCCQWWRHPEGYLRLDALWRAWEFMRLKPGTGMAVYIRDYLDPHMNVLLSDQGPFKGCTLERHGDYPLQPMKVARMPSEADIAALYARGERVGYTDDQALQSVRATPWDGEDQ